MVQTWGYQKRQRVAILLRVLLALRRSYTRPQARLSFSHKEHTPTGRVVRRKRSPYQIQKATSETNLCCPESPASCYLFKRHLAWFTAIDQDNSGQVSAEELRRCALFPS